MEKLKYTEQIDAPREKVWQTLWNDETYRQWTKPFSEQSHASSDWKLGSRVEFHDGNNNGMYSEIDALTPDEFMSFKHLGMFKDGKDVPFEGDLSGWANAHETYRLTENNGGTELYVEVDAVASFVDFMNEKMPQALGIVKRLSES
ncbi:MAG: SRPBCC domain-containing protein [Pyrinomonadaceae bacterium]|nr:SRPBCC domain-containing protein [Pyrinomonadaceae bacterium]